MSSKEIEILNGRVEGMAIVMRGYSAGLTRLEKEVAALKAKLKSASRTPKMDFASDVREAINQDV